MNMPLVLLNRRRRGSVAFSPAALFASAEPGVWYDPFDLTTLYQDNVGTTPVTAAGQTVGLMLDKSQGLALGAELVDIQSATVSVTLDATATFDTSTATFTRTGGATGDARLTVSIAGNAAKLYLVNVSYSGSFASLSPTGTFLTTGQRISPTSGTISAILIGNTTFRIATFSTGIGVSVTIDNISVKELAGNHATQATSTQRPTYQVDGTGLPYLSFDGVDDGMVTNTITPAIDKVQVFAGLRKLSDAAQKIVAEMSATIASNNGAFALTAPNSAAANYNFSSKGTTQTDNVVTTYTAPITSVISGLGDIAGASNLIRVNGSQVGSTLTTQGTGNYLAYPLYIGRRGGASLPYNGRIYSLITRFGANLTDEQITATEAWVNGKTGAY